MSTKKLVKEYTKALEGDPENLVARLRLAGALREIGRRQEAMGHYLGVARAYRSKGRVQQAVAACRSLLELDPSDSQALSLLSELDRLAAEAAPPASTPPAPAPPPRAVAPGPAPPPTAPRAATQPPLPASVPRTGNAQFQRPQTPMPKAGPGEPGRTAPPRMPLWAPRTGEHLVPPRGAADSAEGARPKGKSGPPPAPRPRTIPQLSDDEVAWARDSTTRGSPSQSASSPADPNPGGRGLPLPPPTPADAGRIATSSPTAETQRPSARMPRITDQATRIEGQRRPSPASEDEAPTRFQAPAMSASNTGAALDDEDPTRFQDSATQSPAATADDEGPTRFQEPSASPNSSRVASRSSAPGHGPPTSKAAETLRPDSETMAIDDDAQPTRIAGELFFPAVESYATAGGRLAPDGSPIEPLLGVFSEFPPDAFDALERGLSRVRVAKGEYLLREDDEGHACYVIEQGVLRILKANPAGPDAPELELGRLTDGALVGEFAVLADRRRHASVQAVTDTTLLELPRELFRKLAASEPRVALALEKMFRERLVSTLLSTAAFFQPVAEDERVRLLSRFVPRRIQAGEGIVNEGELATGLYLVVLGELVVTKEIGESIRTLATLREGAYCGEMSLLSAGPATASVTAVTAGEVAHLPPRDFYEVVSAHPALWERLSMDAQRRAQANHSLLTGQMDVI